MTCRTARLPLLLLALAATLASSWAAAATPPDADEPRSADAHASTQFVAQAGAILGPGLGAAVALDARVVKGLYLGAQGGFFSDHRNGYPFVGARASYRIEAGDMRIVPSLGVAHLDVERMDTDPWRTTFQTPVSPTAGLQIAAQLGHFLLGCDLQVMPVHVTSQLADRFGSPEQREETIYTTPVAVFVGATF